jgi:hypothetical protein
VTLTPQAQSLLDQFVQAIGMQAYPIESLEIHFDKARIAQTVKPKLRIERVKDTLSRRAIALDNAEPKAQACHDRNARADAGAVD